MTSWQGKDGPAHIDTPEQIGPGLYRITTPIHVDGTWKTTLRLHHGRQLAGLPIFMPADPAIPVSQVPVESHMTRAFQLDHQLLQREQKKGVPGFLTLAAYLGVGGISFALIFAVGWGLARLERLGGKPIRPLAEAGQRAQARAQDRHPTRHGLMAWLPLAHAGHILADAAIFGVPVGSVLLTIWALNRWGPKDG